MLQRLVPMVAVAAANCVNIPLMRQQELKHGIAVVDSSGQQVYTSRPAARESIAKVTSDQTDVKTPVHCAGGCLAVPDRRPGDAGAAAADAEAGAPRLVPCQACPPRPVPGRLTLYCET